MASIKKSHHFISARMTLSPREQDLLSLMILGLKKEADQSKYSQSDDNIPTSFIFHTSELCEHFSMSRQGLYGTLDEATSSVMERFAEIKNDESHSFEKVSFCSYAEFKNGVLRLSVTKEAARYMLDYSKGFAEIDLKLLLSFKGGYEKRILELISRFKTIDYSTSLSELCLMIGTDFKRFKRFDVFKNTVLIKPIKNIVKNSNGVWVTKEGFPHGFVINKKGRSYQPEDKITFKMLCKVSKTKNADDNTIEKKIDDRYKFVDYLSEKIESNDCSSAEATVFLSLIDELKLFYSPSFITKAKKIASLK